MEQSSLDLPSDGTEATVAVLDATRVSGKSRSCKTPLFGIIQVYKANPQENANFGIHGYGEDI